MCIRDSVYIGRIQTTKECFRREGCSSENERGECRKRDRGYLRLSTRGKFSPHRQVGHAANMHNNEEGIRDESNCTRRLRYDSGYYGQGTIVSTAVSTRQRNNAFPVHDEQF